MKSKFLVNIVPLYLLFVYSFAVAQAPTVQTSNITFSSVSTTSITVNFTNGDGSSRLVVAKAGSAVSANPGDFITYTPNTVFGNGSNLGSGNFAVGIGNSPITVTSLTPGQTYYFRVYEFNGSSGLEYYNRNTNTGNPASRTTLSAEPSSHPSTFTATVSSPTLIILNYTDPTTISNCYGYILLQRTDGVNPGTSGVVDGVSPLSLTLPSGTTYSGEINNGTVNNKVVAPGSNNFMLIPFNYNGSNAESYNYKTNGTPLTASAITIASEPSQASSIIFSSVGTTSMTVNYTNGNGSSRLLIARAGSAVNSDPVDGISYIANNIFGSSGSQLGSGNYVVGSGSGPITVTGLSAGTTYHFRVYEYNGSGGTENYNVNTASGNPNNSITIPPSPVAGEATSIGQTSFTANWATSTGSTNYFLDVSTDAFSTFVTGFNNLVVGNVIAYSVTNLVAGTNYSYRTRASNSSGASSSSNIINLTTLFSAEPTVQANSIVITQPFVSTLQLTWTNGNGSNRLVVARQGGVVNQAPTDGATYLASPSFTSGDDLGGGNYVVYNGTGNSVSVTDIQPNVSYEFFVFEYNGAVGSENYNINTAANNPRSFTASGDATPPVAGVDSTPTTVSPGTNIDVTAQFSDPESGVASARLEYKSTSSSNEFTSLSMTNSTGNTWTAQIPSSALGELGVEYYMRAFNGEGLDLITNPKFIKVNYTEGLTIPISKFGSSVADYRIVSIPLDLTDKKMSSAFGKVLGTYDGIGWRMYRYENGKTSELNTNSSIESGLGYWLIVRENSGSPILSGEGTTVLNLPKTIELKGDWNQIGNPYNFNLLWSDVVAANPGLPGLTIYNGDFIGSSTVLPKFSGGFVKLPAGQTMTLFFPVTKNPSAGRISQTQELRNSLDLPNWQVSLTLKHGDRINSLGGFGMNEKASDGFDVLDQFTLPRFFDQFLEVNHTKKDGRDHYATDVVPTSQNQVWEFSIASSGKEALMTFSWDNSYFGNNDRQLYWMDIRTGKSFDMKATTNYVFDKNISWSFKIIYGDKSFIQENTMVDQLIFHGAYPIPSDEEVTIAFSLPGSDKTVASVEVHDLLGRQIWISENLFPPGYNEVKWIRNGEAPGIYLARISSGKVSRQTRLIVR